MNTQDEAEIREILNDRVKAHRLKDADLMMAHGAKDFVSCTLAPPLRSVGSAAEERNGLLQWFATWKGPITCEDFEQTIEIGGDVAFAHGLARMRGTKADGQDVELWFRRTDCFRKRAGRWEVAHSHSSVPFYMDGSYRACIDLKP
jgi:ketosteroid isomerase-like protein